MSFATLKELAASKKIVTLEIDIPVRPEDKIDILLNYEPGIWFATLFPDPHMEIAGGAISWETGANPYQDYDIGSVKVNGIDYTHVTTFADLRTQSESYYYDIVTTKLYIHFLDWHQPFGVWALAFILVGQTTGFCNQVDSVNGAYFNGVYFEPRIKSVPSISKSKDPLFFGVLKFQGGQVTLENSDGYFDKFADLNIVRQPARLQLGFDTLDYDEYWQGPAFYIESYTRTISEYVLKLQDVRKSLSTPIPPNVLTLAAWPNLNENNVNKPKPILYGTARGVPLICLNEMDETAATYQFLLMDTEFHDVTAVSAVYVGDTQLTAGQWSLNASLGIITINDEYCENDLDDVTVDCTGANIHNSMEIIKDLLLNYGNVQFIPANYDVKEWNGASADARSVYLYLDEQAELIQAIEPCCVASDIIFFPKDGGLFSARAYSEDRVPRKTIDKTEWLDEPQISCDWDKFLSSATINYSKHLKTSKSKSYLNTVYEAEVFARYKSKATKSFDTILATASGAAAKSETIMALSKVIGEIVKRSTGVQNIDLEIMDFIVASPHTRVDETEQLGVYEIIGINKNLTTPRIELTMRYVKPYVEAPEIEYQQGYLWGERIFGEMLHSVTEY